MLHNSFKMRSNWLILLKSLILATETRFQIQFKIQNQLNEKNDHSTLHVSESVLDI